MYHSPLAFNATLITETPRVSGASGFMGRNSGILRTSGAEDLVVSSLAIWRVPPLRASAPFYQSASGRVIAQLREVGSLLFYRYW